MVGWIYYYVSSGTFFYLVLLVRTSGHPTEHCVNYLRKAFVKVEMETNEPTISHN